MLRIEEINNYIKELKENGVSVKEISDGNRSFEDLDKRNTYLIIALCRSNPDIAWKKKLNEQQLDGKTKSNGLFLVGINTPGGVVTYNLEMKYWDLLNIPVIEYETEYDNCSDKEFNERILTIGDLPSSEIDSSYIDRLFNYVGFSIGAFNEPYFRNDDSISNEEDFHDHDTIDVIKRNLPRFLDVIVAYADKHNIFEFDSEDDKYYYLVRYNGITLKLGLLYDGDIVFIESVFEYDEADVIDCDCILKELSAQKEAKKSNDEIKGLSFKPSNKKRKEENKNEEN